MTKTKRKTKQVQKEFRRTEEIELNDGDVLVYRATRSGDVWQFRTWITDDQKYFKQSLKTRDKELATVRAKELYLDIHTKLRGGQKVFDMTLRQLADDYLKDQSTRIREGMVGKGSIGITEGRYKSIKTQVNRHLCNFLKENTKLSTIRPDMFKNKYTRFRRKTNAGVTEDTIINERATIGNVFKYALQKGYIQFNQLPLWEEMKKSGNKRDAFTLSEWKEIYTYLKSWHKNATKNKDNQDDQTERELVRCFILILANTGLRYGELRVLRWRNVSISKTGTKTFAKINVKIGKTGQRDSVIGRRGDLFKKVKSLTKWKDNDDYVFTDIQTGEQLSERTLRRLWEELVDNTSLKDKIPRPVYYCLRHTYATFRLYADVPIFDLASNMGCGVKYIEDHYGHVKREQKAKILTKDFKSESSQFIMEF